MTGRRLATAAVLLLALAGCGDDGGGSATTTTAPPLRSLLAEVADQPPDATAVPTTLAPTAGGFEHTDRALDVLGDDPDLDRLALDCHHADLSACDVLYVGAPSGSLYETYGATCGARIDQPTHQLCADLLVGVAEDPPPTGDDFLDELARQCAAGDLVDCDLLYAEADTNSEAEHYGATCGGRLETDDDCAALVT